MKILMATTEYPPAALGGSAESVRLTAEALTARGHHVSVVTPQWEHAPGPEYECRSWVDITRFPMLRGSLWRWGAEWEVSNPIFWRQAARKIRARAERISADVIHAQDRRMILPVRLATHSPRGAKRGTAIRSTLTLRDIGLLCPIATCLVIERPGGVIPENCGALRLWSDCAPLYARQYQSSRNLGAEWGPRAKLVTRYALLAMERRSVRHFSRLAYVSHGLAAHHRKVLPGDYSILYSPVAPVTPHEHKRARNPSIVLYVGKPSLGKGWDDFVAAAGLVTGFGQSRSVRFVHLGPKPIVTNAWIDSLGALPAWHVELWRCQSAVCVVPSRQADALPRAALEAGAHGIVTVGTNVGGIPEALAGQGILAPAGSPKDLALAIQAGLGSPIGQGEILRQAVMKRFAPDVVAAAHEAVYAMN